MSEIVRDEKPADFLLPESVKNWFTYIYTNMIGGNIEEMEQLYDREFGLLTNNYFKQCAWPEPESIQQLVHEDGAFMLLYTQIYYRHLFSRLQPGMEEKIQSWKNYCAIFDGILDGSLELDVLPASWAFDIVGEFVYQYQSFCQYRAKIATKSDEEQKEYRENINIWDTKKVLTYLHSIIKKSKILEHLASIEAGSEDDKGSLPDTLTQLGYFSMISLARASVLYGDYYTSIQQISAIDFSKKGLFSEAPACHVSVLYHLGFAQLMLQRYADAIRSFSAVALQVARNRSYYSRMAQYEQISKVNDRSLGLLAITMALCPSQRVEEQVLTMVRERYSDKLSKMQKSGGADSSVFEEVFSFAGPKFILPTCSTSEETEFVNRSQQALHQQMNLFIAMVKRHEPISTIRSYLKLYQTLKVSKLAQFRDTDVDTVRSQLISFKHMSHQIQQKQLGMDMHDGVLAAASDVHFYVSNDLIKVDESKSEQRSNEFFITHINKFSKLIKTYS